MHKYKYHDTKYGTMVWCIYCQVTPSEYSVMSSEEKADIDFFCSSKQDKEEKCLAK
jgi:hypothetical protein